MFIEVDNLAQNLELSFQMFYMAIVLYAPSLALNAGMLVWETISKGKRRQWSGNGAIRKKFTLQKPRWEK